MSNYDKLLQQDYVIEKEEKGNAHKIAIVGGVAAVSVAGVIAALYYAYGAKKNAKQANAGISGVSSAVAQLSPEVSQLTQDIPQIESQLSAIQAQQQANAATLQKLLPLANDVAAAQNTLGTIEKDILGLPGDIESLGKYLESVIPSDLATFGADLSKLPVISQLLTGEKQIASYLPVLYTNLKGDLGTLLNDVEGIPSDISKISPEIVAGIQSDYSTFISDLNSFKSLLNSLPSDLQSQITSALGPTLNTIEGDVSPIISKLEAYISPIEDTIGRIQSTVNGIPSNVNAIPEDIASLNTSLSGKLSSLGSSLSSDLSSLGSFFGL